MIGKDQNARLMEAMKSSDADFRFVTSTVTFMIPYVGGGYIRESNKDDAWTVFLEEREELMRFWDSLGKPVILLTGDLHNSFAIKITDRVWEFACGPHNSQNHKVGDEGDHPASGVFDSFGRKCDISRSTYFLDDIDRKQLKHPLNETYGSCQVHVLSAITPISARPSVSPPNGSGCNDSNDLRFGVL